VCEDLDELAWRDLEEPACSDLDALVRDDLDASACRDFDEPAFEARETW
jgi:hypothetical protein